MLSPNMSTVKKGKFTHKHTPTCTKNTTTGYQHFKHWGQERLENMQDLKVQTMIRKETISQEKKLHEKNNKIKQILDKRRIIEIIDLQTDKD